MNRPISTHALCVLLLVTPFLVSCQVAPSPAPTAILQSPTSVSQPTALAIATVSAPKPRYAQDGEYEPGTKRFTLQDGNVTLYVSAFYPALDGAPNTAHGPYPLVVFSTGLGGNPMDSADLLESIVSHGFVVLSSAPRGETSIEFWAGAATRPLDVRRIIDYASTLTASDGELAGLIDTERIGVLGISSGGWTALMEGGAQMDLGWCAAHPDLIAKFLISNCPQFVPHQKEIAAMLGLKSVPEGMWPRTNDARVDAVIAVSPDGDLWGAEYQGVAGVKTPTLIMAGTADPYNPAELASYPIYEHINGAKKSLAVFEGGDHSLGWSTHRDAIIHIMTAFLLAELEGDVEAARALLPENLKLPDVRYETTVTN